MHLNLFESFPVVDTPHIFEIHSEKKDKDISISQSHSYACWWYGVADRWDIYSQYMDLVLPSIPASAAK